MRMFVYSKSLITICFNNAVESMTILLGEWPVQLLASLNAFKLADTFHHIRQVFNGLPLPLLVLSGNPWSYFFVKSYCRLLFHRLVSCDETGRYMCVY